MVKLEKGTQSCLERSKVAQWIATYFYPESKWIEREVSRNLKMKKT